MTFANQVKQTLLQDISVIAKTPELFSKCPGKDFSRNRKISFQSLIQFFLSMESSSIRHELLKYFSYDSNTISNSAFYQQRNKLLPETFSTLLRHFNSHYTFSLYKEKYQLLACDGSSFTFTRNPKDPDSYFAPDGKTTNGYNQVHAVALFDLLSKRYCDTVVQPIRKKNEFQALTQMIDRCGTANTVPVFIADRGFASFNVFAHAIQHGSYFLIRAKDVNVHRLLGMDFPDTENFDIQVNRILTRSNSRKKRLHPELEDQYRFICSSVTFDYLDSDSRKEYSLSLRVLRFKISGDGYENIITNLPVEDFSVEEIKRLYRLRWGIETSFRELKHTLGSKNFHSKKREYIELEIWARLILYNFCSVITKHVVLQQKSGKHTYQVNYTIAYQACHYFLRLHNGEVPPDIESLIRQNILPVRPDRTYARQHRFRVPVSFNYRF